MDSNFTMFFYLEKEYDHSFPTSFQNSVLSTEIFWKELNVEIPVHLNKNIQIFLEQQYCNTSFW